MAHFDVHATTGRNARGTPYVVVVQSSRFDQRPSRVVIPLAVLNASRGLGNENWHRGSGSVYLNPLGILTVPTSALGRWWDRCPMMCRAAQSSTPSTR
jgi:toxin CcdB